MKDFARILPRNTLRSYRDLITDITGSYFKMNMDKILQDFVSSCKDNLIRDYSRNLISAVIPCLWGRVAMSAQVHGKL